jgi:hypothetical protein
MFEASLAAFFRFLIAAAAPCLLVLHAVPLSAQTPQDNDALVAAAEREVEVTLERDFALRKELQVAPDVLTTLQRLREDHLVRAKALVRSWAASDSARLSPTERVRDLGTRLAARYLNEMAMWHVDTAGADYEQRLLKAFASPALCAGYNELSDLERVARLANGLPANERQSLLADQGALLERWGTRRPELPMRPAATAKARGEATLKSLRDEHREGVPPMPPVLAWMLTRSPNRVATAQARCPLLQWWLQQELARPGADPHAAFLALRYSDVPSLAESPPGSPEYPRTARRYGVEGTVTVRGRVGPNGLLDAEVVERRIRVAGVDQPVVAFETALDNPSLARAATLRPNKDTEGQTSSLKFDWKLKE